MLPFSMSVATKLWNVPEGVVFMQGITLELLEPVGTTGLDIHEYSINIPVNVSFDSTYLYLLLLVCYCVA